MFDLISYALTVAKEIH